MKKSLYYGILVLLLASLGQEAHAMKWANGFRIGMKTLNYAGIIGYYGYSIKKGDNDREKMIKDSKIHTETLTNIARIFNEKNPNLSQDSQNNIRKFIHNAYPELKDIEIQIIVNTPGFGIKKLSDNVYLLGVPFNEQEFQKAICCKEKNILGYTRKTASQERWKERLTLPQYISKCEIEGKAMTPTTLDLWKTILLHEASHIAHKDPDILNNPLPYIIVILGTEKFKKNCGLDTIKLSKNLIANNIIKGTGSLISIPIKVIACSLCFFPINYWKEYRADQDAIKKTQNPDLLQAASKSFNTLPQPVLSTIPEKISYYLDPHPNKNTRAAYFAKGAQKLENEQDLTRQALAYYMSGDDVPRKD